jgi:predicted unusual protein kinase regulating ubiquinone biosynthesis (AarF/ABC1/UbiB family)
VLPDVDSQWLIDRDEIEFVEKLGSGASAKVYKAMYRSEEVAVKVLKHSTHREVDVDAFLKEFKVMR